jgi:oligoribonuclease
MGLDGTEPPAHDSRPRGVRYPARSRILSTGVSVDRSAENLIWIDLEFTNLDPTKAFIMQAAMIVTTKDLVPIPPPGVEPEVGGLLYDVQLGAEQVATASPWVKENQKEQLARSQGPDGVPVETVQDLFIAYLLHCCEVPQDKRNRPLLSGNSVHGDHGFIEHHMPRLGELLSFRLLDVTTVKELARRWCPDLEFEKNDGTIRKWYPAKVELAGQAHDALYDIKGSIAELNFYRHHVFAEAARPKAPAATAAATTEGPPAP